LGDRIVYEQGGSLFVGTGPTLNDGFALTGRGSYEHPDWSPDGSSIVYDYSSDPLHPANLWIRSADDAFVPRRLTNLRILDYMPAWSRDGNWVAFHSRRSPENNVWVVPANGGTPRALGPALANERSLSWSPTGARLAYELFEEGSSNIWLADVGAFKTRRFAGTLASDEQPRWLPDGSGIGFLSLASKGWNVWIQDDRPDAAPRQVTTIGDVVLYDWLQGGKAVMFLTGDGKLYAQRADSGSEPVYIRDVYDFVVSPDGRRYVYVLFLNPAYKRYVEPVPSDFLP
jgi:Tol biopolymer transport system component